MHQQSVVDAGKILAECQELLAELRLTYANDPRGEYQRLAMLALEREQLVSYAYREDILGQRLDKLVADHDIVDVMRHAFIQVWRDEEAHTVLIRGTLVGGVRPSTGLARASIEQTAGWLAGWSSALKHHVPRSSAPLRTLLVDGMAQSARVIGKLSPDLREELKPKSFRDFCRYNVDAEETAELCWDRLIELERELGGPDVATFQRIAREEREHRDVFATIASVLDEHDWVVRGTTAANLADRLRDIGTRFAQPEPAGQADPADPAGPAGPAPSHFATAAPVHVLSSSEHSRAEAVTEALDLLGDVEGSTVVIQSSWMMGYSTSDRSTVIDPTVLNLVVDALIERGAKPTVIDAPNLYSGIFDNRSVHSVSEHFGIAPNCEIADGIADVVELVDPPVLGPSQISRLWLEADVRISLVPLRSHPREHLHATVATLESVVPDSSDSVFWQRRYDHSVAAVAASIVAPPHLAMIDAWANIPNCLFGIMAGRDVVNPGRLYASTDALACDLIALRHTGSARSVTSATLRRLIEWYGDIRTQIEVIGDDTEIDGWRSPYDNIASGLLADLSYPVFAYLSRSGAVFAPPMDDAFPEIEPLPKPLKWVRSIARIALGLRPPARDKRRQVGQNDVYPAASAG